MQATIGEFQFQTCGGFGCRLAGEQPPLIVAHQRKAAFQHLRMIEAGVETRQCAQPLALVAQAIVGQHRQARCGKTEFATPIAQPAVQRAQAQPCGGAV